MNAQNLFKYLPTLNKNANTFITIFLNEIYYIVWYMEFFDRQKKSKSKEQCVFDHIQLVLWKRFLQCTLF